LPYCKCSSAGRLLGAYNLGVATPRALVHAGDKTSGDARSWYMISGDAKSWVVIVLHIFTVILHNCPLFEILAQRLGFLQTYELTNIIVDVFEYHFQIMLPRMMTQSAGRPTVASRGGGTSGRAARGGGRTRVPSGDRGSQCSNQGNGMNQNGDAVNDNIQGVVRNVIENNDRRGCTYKEFLACNPKEYDGKGGAIVEEFCPSNEMKKLETELWNHAMVGAGHAVYTDRFHELARLVPHLVTPESKRVGRYIYGLAPQIRGMVVATEPSTIQKAMQITGTLTDEALRNGSIKKNPEKRGNGGEPSKDMNGREDNKRTRTKNVFDTTTNHVKRDN
ncbi:hypothetical protein Tco_1436069, partial [Tanacetum coccineum]